MREGLEKAIEIINSWIGKSKTTVEQQEALQAVAADIEFELDKLD